MGRYNKLLVAFDDSESSRNALSQTLAAFEDGWIKVLAVVPAYEGDLGLVGIRDLEDLLRGPRKSVLESARKITLGDAGRVTVDVAQGDAFEKIVETAEKENCNLIVMGRHGLHRLERMLMGSVTAKVIVHTGKDVLVIPQEGKIAWNHIMVALDGSEYSQAALDNAMYLVDRYGDRLTAVSVVDMYPEFYADAPQVVAAMEQQAMAVLAQAEATAASNGIQLTTQVLHGDPAAEINSFARKNSAGMVIMGSRGRTGLKKLFLGSVAQKVIGLCAYPVLVAKLNSQAP